MVEIILRDRAGGEFVIQAAPDRSLMEAIREAGVGDLEALCGGSCSCATCHVYLDTRSLDIFGEPGAFEKELLENSDHQTAASRLSCQLKIVEDMSPLAVTIAPKD